MPMNICNRERIGRRNQSFFNKNYSGPFYESEEGYADTSLENQTLGQNYYSCDRALKLSDRKFSDI